MTKKQKRKLQSAITSLILIIVFAVALLLLDVFGIIDINDMLNTDGKQSLGGGGVIAEGNLEAHFIDVGQADCALFMTKDANMLIDTGDRDDDYTKKIINYLKDKDVKKLDYLVLTHPDSDHIGGAPEIINEFEVVNCIMPDFTKGTNIFENTMAALEDKNVNVIEGKAGYSFEFGDTFCNVLAPIGSTTEANDSSVVIKLTHGDNVFMLTGDAEVESEERMLAQYKKEDLDADFLKSGHHGSSTSSTVDFLDAVTPEYAVISCGKDNDYGHPHDKTLEKYEERGIEYYRTDIYGTLLVVSDGKTLTLTTEKNP